MKKEEQDKIWSRVPKGGPIPRRTGQLTVAIRTPTKKKKDNFIYSVKIVAIST
jgi:hypothetical protein